MRRLWARLVAWLDRPLPDRGGHSPQPVRVDLRDVRLPSGRAPGASRRPSL